MYTFFSLRKRKSDYPPRLALSIRLEFDLSVRRRNSFVMIADQFFDRRCVLRVFKFLWRKKFVPISRS